MTAFRHLVRGLVLLIVFGPFPLDGLISYRGYQCCSAVDGENLLGDGTRIVAPT